MKYLDTMYLREREAELDDWSKEELIRLITDLEIFLSHYEIFNTFYSASGMRP